MSDGAVISLIGDSFRRLVRRALGQPTDAPAPAAPISGAPEVRSSSGLREFWKGIQSPSTLHILDLGSASQANVSFITGLGHKIYTEDLPRALLTWTPSTDAETGEEDEFFRTNLLYEDGQFDGILCWDLFDFLAEPLVKPAVGRLHQFLKPGGSVLGFFHTGAAGQIVPLHQYRIRTEATLQLTKRGTGKLCRHFNNRTIENLFRQYTSLKFYLARDNLREVIIVR